MRAYGAVSIKIAKFKLCQYQWRAISPNLIFAKVTCYTVCVPLCVHVSVCVTGFIVISIL